MPVWHAAAKQWAKDGKVVLLGVTQEQHPERCRLFAQWKGFDWPILHDPINVLESSAVPIVLSLDEHGIVRSTRPKPETFENDFLTKTFADDAKGKPTRRSPVHPPKFDALKAAATAANTALAWRESGDALTLWGGEKHLNDAVAAYTKAAKLDPKNGAASFRLGVCLRKRSETPRREADDFQAAVAAWDAALDIDPNQYIWRRRIQQYGPRLDKPYPFYDWVPEAEADIRKRGDTPLPLPVRPGGAEIAKPIRSFESSKAADKNPDPNGRVSRDAGAVTAEVVAVPAAVKAGQSVRVHVTLRLSGKNRAHWNNEAEPLRVWVEPPAGVAVSERLIAAVKPKAATSDEPRTIDFEVQLPKDAKGTIRVPVFALYHICDDDGSTCRFVRLDAMLELKIK